MKREKRGVKGENVKTHIENYSLSSPFPPFTPIPPRADFRPFFRVCERVGERRNVTATSPRWPRRCDGARASPDATPSTPDASRGHTVAHGGPAKVAGQLGTSGRFSAGAATGSTRQGRESFFPRSEPQAHQQMTKQRDLHTWKRAAGHLAMRLGVDHRNHRLLCDPWYRAAHCMVQGWRNIASQGRLSYSPPPQRRLFTWKEAAKSMMASLKGRRQSRLLDQTTWRFWASHIPRVALRYIPKRERRA